METFSLVSFFRHDDMLCRCWENLFPSKNNSSDGSPPGEIHVLKLAKMHRHPNTSAPYCECAYKHKTYFFMFQNIVPTTNDSFKAFFSCCCGKKQRGQCFRPSFTNLPKSSSNWNSVWLFSNFSHMLGLTFPITTTSILSSDPPCPPACMFMSFKHNTSNVYPMCLHAAS